MKNKYISPVLLTIKTTNEDIMNGSDVNIDIGSTFPGEEET